MAKRSSAKRRSKKAAKPRRASAAAKPSAIAPFHPLPPGSRDLLPPAYRLRRAVTTQLLDCFERWGFDPINTPAIEYYEVVRLGLGEQERERCVRFIEAGSGALVTLRSDITPQVARLVSQRMGERLDAGETIRLCYAADVVRLPDDKHENAEFHQAGVELVGDGDPAIDAELIALSYEALRGVGLGSMGIDLAHTGVMRDVFGGLDVPKRDAQRIRAYLGRKDRGGLATELSRVGVKGRVRDAVLSLCELYGPPQVLTSARKRLKPLGVDSALDRLDEVLDALSRDDPKVVGHVSIDLGEVRGFDYYTGLRLRVWAPGVSEPVVRGGRYNDLLGRYGIDQPATGFAVDLDALERALLAAEVDVDGADLKSSRLIAVDPRCDTADARAVAMAEARAARARGVRAWVEVGLSGATARAAAERAGAQRMIFLTRGSGRGASGVRGLTKERWRHGAKGWKRESTPRKRSK
jgi:ATP phosphoribosyltransferase regulatory subunit